MCRNLNGWCTVGIRSDANTPSQKYGLGGSVEANYTEDPALSVLLTKPSPLTIAQRRTRV